MAPPRAASKCGKVQPPNAKPPVGSSLGPPGACMTPSRLVKVATTILRISFCPWIVSMHKGRTTLHRAYMSRQILLNHPPQRLAGTASSGPADGSYLAPPFAAAEKP